MYEVELKVPADLDTVRDSLVGAGAERRRALEQVDTYYDAPHRDFAETDEALRLREETPIEGDVEGNGEATTKITYKGPLLEASSKTREEHETPVADGDAMAGILDGLGFEPAATVRKDRTFYALGGFTVTLDHVDDVGEFVEVETTVDSEAEISEARNAAEGVLERIGLDSADQIRTSYLGLLMADDE